MDKLLSPLPTDLTNTRCGLEIEYGFINSSGKAVGEINGKALTKALNEVIIQDKKMKKNISNLGGFKEEVFKHQIELYTHAATSDIVESAALELHDILLYIMKKEFSLVVSEDQPISFPGGGKELLTEKDYYIDSMGLVNNKGTMIDKFVTDKGYYKDAISDIMDKSGGVGNTADDFLFAWQASTTAIHLHRSFKNSGDTMKLWYALMHKTSLDILGDKEGWWRKYGMSEPRHNAWGNIVKVRSLLEEILNPVDEPIIPELSHDRNIFTMNRYFPSGNMKKPPITDHGPWAIKSPGGITVEGRMVDGPGNNKNKIKEAIQLYNQKTQEAIEHFNSSHIISGTQKKILSI